MIYRKLFDWIDGDDACEATAVTLYSAHDPSHDGEKDFIIRRVKSLIETGVTIRSITLTVWPNNDTEYQVEVLSDFINVIKNIYRNGDSIEAMVIKVNVKENGH
tara:strand:+ start:192 stop:503 length:312 start_codon:yes stop_codon:yes gene_type:complete